MAIAMPIGQEPARTLWRLRVRQGRTGLALTPVGILEGRRAEVHLSAKKQDRHERSNELLDKELFHHGNSNDLEEYDEWSRPRVAQSTQLSGSGRFAFKNHYRFNRIWWR